MLLHEIPEIDADAVLLGWCLTLAPINGQTGEQRDRNWWNALPHPQKVGLVGMADPKTGQFDKARAEVANTISKAATDLLKNLDNVTAGNCPW